MDAAVYIGAPLALAIVAMLTIGSALPPLPRWPESTPRPFGCAACGCSYSDARVLIWHRQSMHVETWDVNGADAVATLGGACSREAATSPTDALTAVEVRSC